MAGLALCNTVSLGSLGGHLLAANIAFDTDLLVSSASAYTDFNRTLEVLRTNES
jgi:hypothetical protein